MRIATLIAAALLATIATGATAAAIDADAPNSNAATLDAPLALTSDDEVIVHQEGSGARVYGWRAMPPADCGTFKYWNGAYCADARAEPPSRD